MNALGLGGYGSEDEEMQEEGQRQQRLISASGTGCRMARMHRICATCSCAVAHGAHAQARTTMKTVTSAAATLEQVPSRRQQHGSKPQTLQVPAERVCQVRLQAQLPCAAGTM